MPSLFVFSRSRLCCRFLARVVPACIIMAFSALFQTADADEQPIATDHPARSSIEIGNGQQVRNGIFVLVEYADPTWKLINIGRSAPTSIDPSRHEILSFSRDMQFVEPFFDDYYQFQQRNDKSGTRPIINPYICFSGQKKERPAYNPCDSRLTKSVDPGKQLFANVVSTVFTFGIFNMGLGLGSAMSVDNEKVRAVLSDIEAMTVVPAYVSRILYREEFERAISVVALRRFIEKYRDRDPDNFVLVAMARVQHLENEEALQKLQVYRDKFAQAKLSREIRAFIQLYESNDPDGLVPRAMQHLKEAERQERIAAQVEAERLARESAELAKWRAGLKSGDDTFCGPVIEVKQPMVRIALKVQLPGYAGEQWLKGSEVFPQQAGCSNTNGRLAPAYHR